jgi:prepilin-type processing-associated H-X9-DG protein
MDSIRWRIESAVRLTLDFDMDQDPVLGAVVTADLEQFVDAMFAGLGVANDFLQFLIEWDRIVGPIDAGMDGGKAETQERLEVTVERQLPGTVVDLNQTRWWELPANYHNNAGSLSFADGHAEIRRWQ